MSKSTIYERLLDAQDSPPCKKRKSVYEWLQDSLQDSPPAKRSEAADSEAADIQSTEAAAAVTQSSGEAASVVNLLEEAAAAVTQSSEEAADIQSTEAAETQSTEEAAETQSTEAAAVTQSTIQQTLGYGENSNDATMQLATKQTEQGLDGENSRTTIMQTETVPDVPSSGVFPGVPPKFSSFCAPASRTEGKRRLDGENSNATMAEKFRRLLAETPCELSPAEMEEMRRAREEKKKEDRRVEMERKAARDQDRLARGELILSVPHHWQQKRETWRKRGGQNLVVCLNGLVEDEKRSLQTAGYFGTEIRFWAGCTGDGTRKAIFSRLDALVTGEARQWRNGYYIGSTMKVLDRWKGWYDKNGNWVEGHRHNWTGKRVRAHMEVLAISEGEAGPLLEKAAKNKDKKDKR